MKTVNANIYIAVDSNSPRISKKNYGYILECEVSGEIVTKDGYGQTEGSYHKATLDALAEALERFTKRCEVTIHTEDGFVVNMIVANLDKWSKNGFLTAKGKPVSNQAEWIHIWEASKNHTIYTKAGKHTYSKWLCEEIKRRK